MPKLDVTIKELHASLKRNIFLKYIIFTSFTIFGSLLLLLVDLTLYPRIKSFTEIFIFSGLISLAMSIFNDVLVRKDSETKVKIERDEFARSFADEFYGRHAITLMPEHTVSDLVQSPERREIVVQALSRLVVDDSTLQTYVSRSYFDPIANPPKYKKINATSKLQDFDQKTGNYTWNFWQRFVNIEDKLNFRIFICESPELAARLESAGRVVDYIMLVSKYDYKNISEWFEKNFNFSGTIFNEDLNRFTGVELKKSFDMSELVATCSIDEIDEKKGFYCRVYSEKRLDGASFEFSFKQALNAYQDPFFCWTFEEYAFVESVEVDYASLAPYIGRVSPVQFVRSSLCQIEHKRDEGLYRVTVNDMVGPGEGFVLVFRRK